MLLTELVLLLRWLLLALAAIPKLMRTWLASRRASTALAANLAVEGELRMLFARWESFRLQLIRYGLGPPDALSKLRWDELEMLVVDAERIGRDLAAPLVEFARRVRGLLARVDDAEARGWSPSRALDIRARWGLCLEAAPPVYEAFLMRFRRPGQPTTGHPQ